MPVDHGCHTTYPDFDLVNDTSWRHFTTYKRPTSKEPNELINIKPWRQKTVPFSIDFSSWNQKHQQKKYKNTSLMSMTPTAIPSPPVGMAANEKSIEGADTRHGDGKISRSLCVRTETNRGEGTQGPATAKRKEESDARKVDSARRRAATQEKRKIMADNKAAKERAELEKLMAKLEEAKKKTAEADKISMSFTTDALTKESKSYLAPAESAQLRHQGKKTKAADNSAADRDPKSSCREGR